MYGDHGDIPMRSITLISLITAILLSGCASTPIAKNAPPLAYWKNAEWLTELETTINQNLQYPAIAAHEHYPAGTAMVAVTYDRGKLTSPHILVSTGSLALDQAIISQMPFIRPPPVRGLKVDGAHNFELFAELFPSAPELYKAIRGAIAEHARYPYFSPYTPYPQIVVARFNYKNGRMLNPEIARSFANTTYNQFVLRELQRTSLPKPPDWLEGTTLDFSIEFCFSGTYTCQQWLNRVHLIKVNTINFPEKPCAEIGFIFVNKTISDIRIIASSGTISFDSYAVKTISEGEFPRPISAWDNDLTFYDIPVCSSKSYQVGSTSTKQ